MGSIWTVTPETDRYELELGGHAFWIEIKRDLTEGELRRVQTAGFQRLTGLGEQTQPARLGEPAREMQVIVDWTQLSYARTLAYLVDWSLSDDKGNKLPLEPASRKRDTIEQLRPEVCKAIEEAITAHVERRELEKKATTGEPRPRAISA